MTYEKAYEMTKEEFIQVKGGKHMKNLKVKDMINGKAYTMRYMSRDAAHETITIMRENNTITVTFEGGDFWEPQTISFTFEEVKHIAPNIEEFTMTDLEELSFEVYQTFPNA
jgi:hypothetical protein